ncbi:MAG: hypothetical protein GX853_05960 [Chloroflexi bacterium]|nr:hypothetical protein [Chloroflexota bacterium]
MQKRREIISWTDLTRLVDHLIPQFDKSYSCILAVNQAAIIPASLVAEAMGVRHIFLISVHFHLDMQLNPGDPLSIEWPVFSQFPLAEQLHRHELLLLSEHWHSGREVLASQARLEREGFSADCAALHFDPSENRLEGSIPRFYAARTVAEIIYPWQASTGYYPKMVGHLK